MAQIKLYSYWRSSCSYRVRIVLGLKGIDYDYIPINLIKAEQNSEENLNRNPMGLVPTLEVDGVHISQSMAIMEYLEENYKSVMLFPQDSIGRAIVRGMCMIIVADTQPLQNLKVLKTFEDPKRKEWAIKVISDGLFAFEKMAKKYSGKYSYGSTVTIADACLVPQVYNAKRFEIEMDKFPTISIIMAHLEDLEGVQKAHPQHMIDAVQ
eukprot:NODE_19_length_47148_cov_1.447810.p30 type:complete len:209 gc:universal NODE_19_length_47148_cov_1.447810:41839-42465(+)